MSFESILGLRLPLYWNSWPIEEEFARYFVYRVATRRPKTIVELGSGMSTLLAAKTLDKLGVDYLITSIDSDADFLEQTKSLLIAENVYDKEKIKLVFSPLRNIEFDAGKYLWYTPGDFVFSFDMVDFLFVDGPVGGLCKNARYPAMNIMRPYLKKGSLVVMHDAKRADEKEIAQLWREENAEIKRMFEVDTPRGGLEIQF